MASQTDQPENKLYAQAPGGASLDIISCLRHIFPSQLAFLLGTYAVN